MLILFGRRCVLLLLLASFLQASRIPRQVCVINSYYAGLRWTDEQVRGISEALGESEPVTLWVEHLDAPRSPEHARSFPEYFKSKHRNRRFDLVITTDEPALELAIQRGEELFGGAPVVFAGVSDLGLVNRAPRERFTGVIEQFRSDDMLLLALRLHPATERVFVVSDRSALARSLRQACKKFAASQPRLAFHFLDTAELSFSQMVQRLSQAPENSLVVTTLLAQDHNGDYLPRAATLRRLAAATRAPVWTMASDRVGHGILGGNASLGLLHGRMTAAVARDVLYGHAPAEVAVRIDDRNEFLLDYGEMRRWKIPEASLPDDVVVVNRPFSFLRANRVWILAGLGFLAAQTLIIAALVASILRRRRAETLLARQRQALEQSRDGIVILSPEGEIQYANSAIARMFGYAEGEMAGRPLLEPGAADTDGAREQTRKDGSKFMARFSSSPLHNSKGVATGVVSIVRDITLERALEERVHHAQKMDCVGRLAGGIAHDFNNMLTVINGYSAQVLAQVAPGGPVAAGVAEIRKAGERASSLTRQLLAFSRREQIRPAVLDLNAELSDVAGILRHLMGGNVDLVLSPGPNLGRVRLDPGQLLQVVVNLVINARDAMPSGGTLLVETCNAGDQVVLAVRDTGVGMTPGVRDRIFEPFFTTKERGMGTGLGLSTVYGIVEQAGGTIEVTSAPDLGTTFRIALPRVAGDLEAPPETETSDVRGSETILLVESDPPLRRLLAEALARYGYRILEAGSGEEALQLAARYPGAIELMVADPVLPGGAGKVLADRMESLRPYTKVLYISGPPGETVLGSASNYLQKPFTPAELAHGIRQLLGQR